MMLWFLRDPYSVEGLKHRASKLPNCPYKLFLELTATQLEMEKALTPKLLAEIIGKEFEIEVWK